MDLFTVPAHAIDAFEKRTGARISVHDLAGTLRAFLPAERFFHKHPMCEPVRMRYPNSCIAWDITTLRREISSKPEGRVQVCFAGLVEAAVPVYRKKALEWMLFAGPRLPGKNLRDAARDDNAPPPASTWPKGIRLPAPIDDDEAQLLLEDLRQLAARLKLWIMELESSGVKPPTGTPDLSNADDLATRRGLVQRFIATQHTRAVSLQDLAEYLHLSESRASHAVKETCGQTFLKLLTAARLRTAAGLLQHTDLSVFEVAMRSGFSHVSHFHRCFQQGYGSTPLKYRRQQAAQSNV